VDPNILLPLASSGVSFLFGALVLAQGTQAPSQLPAVWAIGLLWYGISAGTEFWGSAFGWSEPCTGSGI
jgi:hypothetical protein